MWVQLSTACSNLLKSTKGNSYNSCSRPQPDTDNGVKDGISNWLVAHPPSLAVPPSAPRELEIGAVSAGNRFCNLQHARQPPCPCGHWGYKCPPRPAYRLPKHIVVSTEVRRRTRMGVNIIPVFRVWNRMRDMACSWLDWRDRTSRINYSE